MINLPPSFGPVVLQHIMLGSYGETTGFFKWNKKNFEIIITIFLLYLSFLQTLPYISHHSLSNSLPLFLTSCYCMVRYTQIHIPKYNRFSLLYNVAYMYIFRADWHWTISLCTCPWRPPLLFPVSFSYV